MPTDPQPPPHPPATNPSARAACAQFIRHSWPQAIAISVAILIPCFWHGTIQAGDLASHTYNAWLAQLIERGQAPGLYIVHPWNNVLFDLALLHLGNLLGLRAAERIAVGAAVLIFFWGAFAFLCAISRRVAWSVLPSLAALAYGWTFSQGFFNYYIAVGLALLGVALIYSGAGRERWLAAAIVPLIWMAHPLGLALLAALSVYSLAIARFSFRGQFLLFAGAIALLVALRMELAHHFRVLFTPDSPLAYLADANGADQFVLYGSRYAVPALLFLTLIAAAVLVEYFASRKAPGDYSPLYLSLQLYALALVAGFLLPWVIFMPQYAAPLGMLTERFSLITAVFACCIFAATRPRPWHCVAAGLIAFVFFFFLYQDTAKLDRLERQARTFAANLPRGARVVGVIDSPPGSRLLVHHLVDRACIAFCFSYGNYEPSSGQFRVRAAPGNPYVTADWAISEAIRTGVYVIPPQEAPIFAIYACDATLDRLCLRPLSPGESVGNAAR